MPGTMNGVASTPTSTATELLLFREWDLVTFSKHNNDSNSSTSPSSLLLDSCISGKFIKVLTSPEARHLLGIDLNKNNSNIQTLITSTGIS